MISYSIHAKKRMREREITEEQVVELYQDHLRGRKPGTADIARIAISKEIAISLPYSKNTKKINICNSLKSRKSAEKIWLPWSLTTK